MEQEIIDFINKHEDLIDHNDWTEVYQRANKQLILRRDTRVGDFTTTLLNVDIHPENYLSELPDLFLCRQNITSFKIPNNITSIGYGAFEFCSSLVNIIIPDNVTSIGGSAFYGCTRLTSVDIGDGVTSISSYAFSACPSLTSIVVNNSVESISNDAFANCGKNLVIEYKGTKEEWKNIYNVNAFKNTYFTVNCTDGKIVKKKRQ